MNASTEPVRLCSGQAYWRLHRWSHTIRDLRDGEATREFTLSHEQTETNPAQPRERLEDGGERDLEGGHLLLSGTARVKFGNERRTLS